MASVIENILLGRQYIALEFFALNRQEKIALLEVQKKRKELIIAQNEIFDSIDALNGHKSKSPAVLIINNDQVLQKEVQGNDASDKKLLHKGFPNLQTDDFYYEIWRKESFSIIAICRKSYVDTLIDTLHKEFRVNDISLGVLGVSMILGFDLPEKLNTNTETLFLDAAENIVAKEAVPPVQYTINGLTIQNTHLLGFCGILKFILPTATTGTVRELGLVLEEKFKQKTFFEKGIKIGVAILLSLLLANFFLFSYYFGKANEMSETVSLNRAGIENLTKIKERIKDKEQKLESFTNNAASSSSLVINDLVKNTPASILLSQLDYHPLEKKIKEDEALTTKDSLMVISGTILSNTAFTDWVENIEKTECVKNVIITSFGKSEETETEFSINVILKR